MIFQQCRKLTGFKLRTQEKSSKVIEYSKKDKQVAEEAVTERLETNDNQCGLPQSLSQDHLKTLCLIMYHESGHSAKSCIKIRH